MVNICEHLDPIDLIALQFQSDVWRSVARRTMKAQELETRFSFKNVPSYDESPLVEFEISMPNGSAFQILFERPDPSTTRQILSFGDGEKRSLICKSANFEELFENMTALKTIIDCSYRSVESDDAWVAVDSELPQDPLLAFLESGYSWNDVRLTELDIELETVPGEVVNEFLKVLKVTRKLEIILNSDEKVDFKMCATSPPRAHVTFSDWLTIDQVIDLNVEMAFFENCAFTDADMNTFLSRWMNGEVPNAKLYTFITNSRRFRSKNVLRDLKAERWSPETREKKYKLPIPWTMNSYEYQFEDLSAGMDIIRSDGVIGTLRLNVYDQGADNNHNLHFYVWPEPFPMRTEMQRLTACTEQFDRFLAHIDWRLLVLAKEAAERFWCMSAVRHNDPKLYAKLGEEGRKATEAYLNKKYIRASIRKFLE
ncbi:unnamed protein product [Caenorhabditis sp. 36 PRJEB53466]|nr:unnamed protein product [Caenorhabditis sp. 36 PRJEB53466]